MHRRIGLVLAASLAALALALAVATTVGVDRYDQTFDTETWYAENFTFVAYHDLAGRPAFKMAMQVMDDHWYLYLAHLWDRGWSILDVTDPVHPELVRFVEGPDNTMTIQVQVSHGLMLTALERPGFRGHQLVVLDVSDPRAPRELISPGETTKDAPSDGAEHCIRR